MIERPHYIIVDKDPDTSFVLKSFEENRVRFRLILRLQPVGGEAWRKNSVITFQYIKVGEYQRLLDKKKMLYKAPDV